jgi:hypothetical protein
VKHAIVAVFLVGCSSGATTEHTARGEPVARTCEQTVGTNGTRPLFHNCPHWRMAMPEACGSSRQPSVVDPCACLCDLCERDSDCGSGTCIAIASDVGGGSPQKTCVHEDEPCFPDGTCPAQQSCRNYDGHPRCE